MKYYQSFNITGKMDRSDLKKKMKITNKNMNFDYNAVTRFHFLILRGT